MGEAILAFGCFTFGFHLFRIEDALLCTSGPCNTLSINTIMGAKISFGRGREDEAPTLVYKGAKSDRAATAQWRIKNRP